MDEFNVRLTDGDLRAIRWGGEGPAVVAIHGITANALAWSTVADALGGEVQLVAPDLRGRAGSAGLGAPYGLAQHARDTAALLDYLGVERCVLVGHSMGAFVAALAAGMFPDRVVELVLVDGGVTLAVPDPTADIDVILEAVIGPAIRRLQMTFASGDAYLDFWRAHPAFAHSWSPALERYLLRDLVGKAPQLHSSCVLEAVRADGADTLVNRDVTTAVHRVACATTLMWASRGMLDDSPGLYTPDRLTAAGVQDGVVNVLPAVDANHYTILLDPEPAAAVAEAIRTAVRSAHPDEINTGHR
jgi:pimeloyl-ACP methyl ester carboxylesterase